MIENLANIKLFRCINSIIPPPFRRHYSYYSRTKKLIDQTNEYSTKEMLDFQLIQFNKVLKIGWNIEGYKKFWIDNGFLKNQIYHIDEISKIPVITKEIIQQNRHLFKPIPKTPYKKTSTGGSTGTPFLIYEPKTQSRIETAFIHDAWKKYYPEISIKTKSTIMRGVEVSGEWDYDPMKGLILSTFALNKNSILKFKHLIEKYQTPILHAYPSSLFLFSKMLKNNNIRINHRFKCICLGSEPLFDHQVSLINEVYNSPIVHWYGQGEKIVLATTKPNCTSFHVYPQYGYTEVLNEYGKPQSIGKAGSIIGTSFWNNSLPLIRYNTLDNAIVSKYPSISESKYSFVLDKIIGRSQDFLLSNNDSLIPVTALNVTCSKYKEIKRVRFHQEKQGVVEILIELLPSSKKFNSDCIIQDLETITNQSIHFIPKVVEEIKPTKTGKHVYLIQNLDIDTHLSYE